MNLERSNRNQIILEEPRKMTIVTAPEVDMDQIAGLFSLL